MSDAGTIMLPLLQALSRRASGGSPSMFRPAGPAANAIAGLGAGMIVASAVVLAIIVVLVMVPVLRRQAAPDATRESLHAGNDDGERRREMRWIVLGGAAMPMVVLALIFVATLGALGVERAPATTYDVEVTGHQWWWEVRYPNDGVTTANEIHIPVGRPVRVHVASADVIHSFWVPQLQGKTDAITGQVNETWLQADRAGVYRGECAEFCGLQHAHMAFVVVADMPSEYARWLANEQRSAVASADSGMTEGGRVFLASSCVYCHTVRGTSAGGRVGPDLTHIASRRTLGSSTLDNTRANLSAWIRHPDVLKPGTKMPASALDPVTLDALVTYLETLK